MAFDFPNSPSVGQRVTGVGGIVYVWDGVKWASNIGSVTAQSMGDVGRNLLHNPLFNVAQRGAGPFTAVGAYTVDRWRMFFAGGTSSIAQASLSDADRISIGDETAQFSLNAVIAGTAGSGDYSQVVQFIENVRRLSGKTVTVSFYANCGTASLKLGASLVQNFGTGGSPSAAVGVNGQAIALSATAAQWGRYSVTFTLPSVVGKVLGTNGDSTTQLSIWFSSGSANNISAGNIGVQSGTINLWGVQLEIGSVATPLEKPDPRYDLANCQRFYNPIPLFMGGYSVSGNLFYTTITLPTTMRAPPTVAIGSPSYGSASGMTIQFSTSQTVAVYATATATGTSWASTTMTASADL